MWLPKTGYTVKKSGLDIDVGHNNFVLLHCCKTF